MTKLELSAIAAAIVLSSIACRRGSPPAAEVRSDARSDTRSDAGDLPPCYPYAKRDGECLRACDPALPVPYPQSHPDCAQGGWPLLCNDQRECYPVQPEDYPAEP